LMFACKIIWQSNGEVGSVYAIWIQIFSKSPKELR